MVKFYRAAEAAGLKPIVGADIVLPPSGDNAQATQLTLLCQNRAGYLNLCRLLTEAYLAGNRHGVALVQPEWLEAQPDGLIALSCGGGLGNNADLPTTQRGRLTLILEDLAYAVAVPQYQAMTAAFVDLQNTTDAFCAAPDAPGLERTRAAWRRAMETWLVASTVDLGPIGDENRALRIEFWPDANNNVRRAVNQMLVRDDLLTAETLARQSVAAQGLPALELLLFDDTDTLAAFTSGERAARRCTYARAITGNLLTIAQQVEVGWTADGGYAAQLVSAGRGSDVFATREAAIDEVVNQLVATLEDVATWGGQVGAGASDGLRIVKAAQVDAELKRAGATLANSDIPQATDAQTKVIAGLKRLLEKLEETQGLIESDREAAIRMVREMMKKQEQVREQTKVAELAKPEVADQQTVAQQQIHEELGKLAEALARYESAQPLLEQAKASAFEAQKELFEQQKELAKKYEKDMESAEVQQALDEAKDLAYKLGLQGTPLYLIGDRSIPGAPEDLYDQLVANVAEIRKNGCKAGC